MVAIPPINTILLEIKDLPFLEAIVYLTGKGIVNYAQKGYGKLKEVIKEKYNLSKYAFVPSKKEANSLKNFSSQPNYRQVHLLVPNYRYIDIIRTGLLIKSYHDDNTKANRERVKEIKARIKRRPNGQKLLKIADLPTIPFFNSILKLLYDLKLEGYSEKQLEEAFDEAIGNWDRSSLLVKNAHSINSIVKFCKQQIMLEKNFFFLLGMRTAADKARTGLEKLTKRKFLETKGYKYTINETQLGNSPRVEITIYYSK
ncbi:MAG: hypothetical protein KAK00_02455 [Nanoarchaeota archaeon]|nr:hypothetical protein [Nanoarchaeota archaeon]